MNGGWPIDSEDDDPEEIAAYVPEISGMGRLKAKAHVVIELDRFHRESSPKRTAEFARRLIASQQDWAARGRQIPFWFGLLVLRQLKAEDEQT